MKTKANYNYQQNEWLSAYIRKNYINMDGLQNPALQIYLFGIPEMEKKQNGCCKPITAPYRDLGRACFISFNTIEKHLEALNKAGLIELLTGEAAQSKNATMIRRRTIQELEGDHRDCLKDYTTESARKVSNLLNARAFYYGTRLIHPKYCPRKTGRIYTSGPNIQGDPEPVRKQNILQGMNPGEYLIAADYCKAEPTIIKHILGKQGFTEDCKDPYNLLADILDISRDEAKKKFNSLAYARSASAILLHWNISRDTYFHRYAKALDEYKNILWSQGAPKGTLRRHSKTLAGNLIQSDRGIHPHKGQLLNWQVQGTIADIMNSVVLELLKKEQQEAWQFLFPVHDAVYLTAKSNKKNAVRALMIAEAFKLGISINATATSEVKRV